MKKLKLNLDEIKVESFKTSSVTIDKGTIHAHASAEPGEFCDTQAWGLTNYCCDPSGDTCRSFCTYDPSPSACGCPSGSPECIVTGYYLCTYETECYTTPGYYNC